MSNITKTSIKLSLLWAAVVAAAVFLVSPKAVNVMPSLEGTTVYSKEYINGRWVEDSMVLEGVGYPGDRVMVNSVYVDMKSGAEHNYVMEGDIPGHTAEWRRVVNSFQNSVYSWSYRFKAARILALVSSLLSLSVVLCATRADGRFSVVKRFV